MLRFIINRPIGVIMTTIAILSISVVFVRDVPIALLPDIPIPRITVQISAPEMDARTLEKTVVRLIRNQLMQVNDLQDISSRTRNGSAIIDLELGYDTNINLASIEINEKMDQVMHSLPRNIDRPRVIKTNVSDIPVFYLDMYVRDTTLISAIEFSNFIKRSIRKRLEQIPEIAFVDMHGLAEPEILVIPDPLIMDALNIDEKILSRAIVEANIRLGNILLKDGAYQYNVELTSRLVDIKDIEDIYLNISGQILQLKNIAKVVKSKKPRRGAFYYNEHKGASLAVRRKSDANNFKLRAAVDTLMADLHIQHPNIDFQLSNDQSAILDVSISNLRTSLYYGLGFAALVMFLFFRDWRLPLLISISIPVGLTISLFGFYLMDISINIISLAGLILGIGLMIDNAIIIIENIKQKVRTDPSDSAFAAGANEVIRPLISSALTTSSVFLPMILLSGIAGALFYDQALSIALTLTSSILVSYFLLPVLARLIIKIQPSSPYNTSGDNAHSWHATFIKWLVKRRYILLPIMLLLGAGVIIPYQQLEKQTFPDITRSSYSLKVDWNNQISLSENQERYQQLRETLSPWTIKSTSYLGELQYFLIEKPQYINELEMIIYLNDPSHIGKIEEALENIFNSSFQAANYKLSPLENVFDKIFGQDDHAVYAHIQPIKSINVPPIEEIKPLLDDIQKQYLYLHPISLESYIGIKIDYDALLTYNIQVEALVNKIRFIFRNNEVSQLSGGEEFIPIQISKSEELQDIKSLISTAQIRNNDGQLIPMTSFVNLRLHQDYKDITSIRSGECITVPFKSYSDHLMDNVTKIVRDHHDYSVLFSGSYFKNKQLIKELTIVGGVVLLLLFLILAAQFESLIQPLIVALTLPIGILGALLALWIMGETINIIAIIGIIIMSGIDVNDAILKIDIINKNIANGMPLGKAIIDGSDRRIRPILMTSITTILAMTPILFTGGLGAELQRPLGVAVIGGLIFGTFASIVMVPMLYRLFFGWERRETGVEI